MSKKKILKRLIFVLLFGVTLIFVIIITNKISVERYISYGQYHGRVKSVSKLPEGFISLNYLECLHSLNNEMLIDEEVSLLDNLKCKFYPGFGAFIDVDNNCIYEIPSGDSDKIVKYKDEYYIRDWLYDDLVEMANIIAEQRNRIYNIGDAVILRGSEIIPYVIIIDSVGIENVGDFVRSTIRFTTNPRVSEYETPKIFDRVETDKGTIIEDFTIIDEETVQVKLSAGEKISMIILKSPDYEDCIRKVSIE